jgi:hypothetical protein
VKRTRNRRRQLFALLALFAFAAWGTAHALHALSHAFADSHHAGCSHHHDHPDEGPAPADSDTSCAVCDTDLGPLHGDFLPVWIISVAQAIVHPDASLPAAPGLAPAATPARGPPAA